MLDDLKKDAAVRMGKCVATFQADLKKLRTGRAHPSLVEHLKVDYYGSDVPLQQVANIAVEDGRTLVISPWEKSVVQAIEKAIFKSDLGLTPMTAGPDRSRYWCRKRAPATPSAAKWLIVGLASPASA